MRHIKEDAAITREQLLQAAMHYFRAQGYAATTLDEKTHFYITELWPYDASCKPRIA